MKAYTRIKYLRVFGAPVFIHWSVLVASVVLVGASSDSVPMALIAVACYFATIVLHECGHAYFARRLRLDVLAIRIGFLHGSCEYEAPDNARDEYIVAWGGALAQLFVAVPLIVLNAVFGFGDVAPFGPIIVILGYVSLCIAGLNLIPMQGIDGAKAWRLPPILLREWRARRARRKAGKLRGFK